MRKFGMLLAYLKGIGQDETKMNFEDTMPLQIPVNAARRRRRSVM
jgi:hypothetical protein